MVHSYISSLMLLGCGLWICTCITSAVSISSIYFGSILQIFFTSNNNSISHRSSRSVYCSFSSCGIGFPSSPYLFSLPFIQEILPLNYVCAVLPILTCLLFLFVLPLPGVPFSLFHLIPLVFTSSMVHVETLCFHLRSSLLRGSVYRLFPGRSADKSQSNHGRSCSRHLHFGFVLDRCSLFIVASFLSFTDVYLSFSSSLQQFFNFWPSFLPTLVRFIQCLRRFYDTQ